MEVLVIAQFCFFAGGIGKGDGFNFKKAVFLFGCFAGLKFAKENDVGNHFSSCLGFESGIWESNGAKKFSVFVHEFAYFLAFGAIECIA